ncbi:MAG: T9SS type A sorting domain-containing protein, partial [Ignavibacteria bacterium]
GFLYSTQNFGFFSNQIVKYDFSSNQDTVLADGSIYLVGARVSPDGHYFAFADRADENSPYDLFGMAIDGSQQWNIVSDIVSWDWGSMAATDVESFDQVEDFELLSNYPNPFNPSTTIKYSIPTSEFVSLKVYDVLGSEVATLVNDEKPTGNYKVNFNATNLSSGIYFYTLKVGNFTQTKKLILMK